MNEQQAKRLKAAGVDRVNHNLNTSEAFHASICTTHTFQDRLSTIRNARAAGLEICSGGIVGMGEKDEDLIDLAMALRDVKPDSIPLNTLHPVAGTPLENCDQLTPQRCLKVLCLFRFLHPRGSAVRRARNAQLLYEFAAALAHTPHCHRRTCSGDPWNVQGSAFTRDNRENVH